MRQYRSIEQLRGDAVGRNHFFSHRVALVAPLQPQRNGQECQRQRADDEVDAKPQGHRRMVSVCGLSQTLSALHDFHEVRIMVHRYRHTPVCANIAVESSVVGLRACTFASIHQP